MVWIERLKEMSQTLKKVCSEAGAHYIAIMDNMDNADALRI